MEEKYYIYIVLTHSGTVLSSIIKKATRKPFSHVSISFVDDLKPMYSFGRKIPRNPFIGGFVREFPGEGLYEIKDNTYCEIYKIKISNVHHKYLLNIIKSFENKSDEYKYNTIGLITNFFGIKYDSKKGYFCSEFVAEAFRDAGLNILDKHPSLVKPNDFRDLNLQLIYSGYLNKYKDEFKKENCF